MVAEPVDEPPGETPREYGYALPSARTCDGWIDPEQPEQDLDLDLDQDKNGKNLVEMKEQSWRRWGHRKLALLMSTVVAVAIIAVMIWLGLAESVEPITSGTGNQVDGEAGVGSLNEHVDG